MGRLTFVTGGARSGKSTFAEQQAKESGLSVTYLATMEPLDAEMEHRIRSHRVGRPADWATAEEPRALTAALAAIPPGDLVLLDCVSLWVTNLLLAAAPEGDDTPLADLERAARHCLEETAVLLGAITARPGPLVAVSNEVGSGIVPLGALTRTYRDTLGLVNQRFAASADEVHALISGLPLRLK